MDEIVEIIVYYLFISFMIKPEATPCALLTGNLVRLESIWQNNMKPPT